MAIIRSSALYTVEAIRRLEQAVYDTQQVSPIDLMERAGAAAFTFMRQAWPSARLITICCGKGNNGGDGYVLARLAHEAGFIVRVIQVAVTSEELAPTARLAWEKMRTVDVIVEDFNPAHVLEADLIVDAVLGIGLTGEVTGIAASLIAAINASPYPVFALDCPSGLQADTGEVLGCAVKADKTLNFIAQKQGLFTYHGPEYCSELVCDDLEISPTIFSTVPPSASLLNQTMITPWLPRRARDAHKGLYGHILVIGGDYGMGGAVRMAAEAALRVGAGLVTVATRPEHVPVVTGSRPELMCTQVINANDLDPLLEKVSVIVIGPGLGKTEWASSLLEWALNTSLPKVLDADSLNLLAQQPVKRNDWILTPHPGEAARLLNQCTAQIQQDRFYSARVLQQQYGGVMVLKGAGTVVQAAESQPLLCPVGNPGMASGGMGDILSGIIGGLLGQKLSLLQAAAAGVYVHAQAADKAAAEGGGAWSASHRFARTYS